MSLYSGVSWYLCEQHCVQKLPRRNFFVLNSSCITLIKTSSRRFNKKVKTCVWLFDFLVRWPNDACSLFYTQTPSTPKPTKTSPKKEAILRLALTNTHPLPLCVRFRLRILRDANLQPPFCSPQQWCLLCLRLSRRRAESILLIYY